MAEEQRLPAARRRSQSGGVGLSGEKDPVDSNRGLASRPARAKGSEFTFEREDWTLFRSLSTLSQKAGVPGHLQPKLVPKELAENPLEGGNVRVGALERRRCA